MNLINHEPESFGHFSCRIIPLDPKHSDQTQFTSDWLGKLTSKVGQFSPQKGAQKMPPGTRVQATWKDEKSPTYTLCKLL